MSRRKLLQSIIFPAMLLFSQLGFAQDRVITGRVTDSTGNGLAGVTVTAKGSRTATQTNNDGGFSITIPSTVDALIFSSVGFATREIPVISGAPLSVSLSGAGSSLNEVVVIGYGTRM